MADGQAIKAGDVVVLRSGGPHMTVAWVNTDGVAGCHWWNEAASEIKFDRLNVLILNHVEAG